MTVTVRAIYENGCLRPLDPLDLVDHQQVAVTVTTADNDRVAELQPEDPLTGFRISTGISDLAENFEDYRLGRCDP